MKILFVCNRLGYGGAEHVCVMLANGLVDRGHEVAIASDNIHDITYTIDPRIRLVEISPAVHNKYLRILLSVRILRKYVARFRPDVAIGIMWFCSLKAYLACRGFNIPIISTVHDSFERPSFAKMSRMEHFIKFQLNKIYSCVTVLTHADKKVIGDRLKNVFVMPNPLDLAPLKEVPPKKKIILAAGRTDRWFYKGFDILFEAWRKIEPLHSDWKLVVAGESGKTEKREANARKLIETTKDLTERGRLEFLGFQRDMAKVYRESDMFVLSSRYEGFGLVLVEAMSQGCACIACDYNGRQSEILGDANTGELCVVNDVDALAKKMEYLLNHEQVRKVFQEKAILRANYYYLPHVVLMWEKLLNNLVGKKE